MSRTSDPTLTGMDALLVRVGQRAATIEETAQSLYKAGAMIRTPRKLPLRVTQVSINMCTIVTGFCTFMPLGNVWNYFQSQCVLYADLSLTYGTNKTVFIDNVHSIWGNASTCNYTTYTAVVAVIHALIWCCFFVLMRSTLKEQNQEFNILLPSFVLHTIMFISTFVSSGMISAGSTEFCRNIRGKISSEGETCESLQQLEWDIFSNSGGMHLFTDYLLLAKITSWLMSVSILGQSSLCGYRLYTAFLKPVTRCRPIISQSETSSVFQDYSWQDGDSYQNQGNDVEETENDRAVLS